MCVYVCMCMCVCVYIYIYIYIYIYFKNAFEEYSWGEKHKKKIIDICLKCNIIKINNSFAVNEIFVELYSHDHNFGFWQAESHGTRKRLSNVQLYQPFISIL